MRLLVQIGMLNSDEEDSPDDDCPDEIITINDDEKIDKYILMF